MIWLSIIALIVAAVSAAIALYERLWLNGWRPFRLSCDVRGVVWQPPVRLGTQFSMVVLLVLYNTGA